MGMRFRKSINLGGGTRLNFSKSGIGISTGIRGARISINKNGVRKSVGIPGTGIYYSKQQSFKKNRVNKPVNVTMYTVPEGVTIPKVPLKIRVLLYSGIGFLVLGFVFPIVLLIAIAVIISSLVIMLTSKDYKYSFNMQLAINAYRQGKFNKCMKYCNKALRYRDYEGAKILIRQIEENFL